MSPMGYDDMTPKGYGIFYVIFLVFVIVLVSVAAKP